MRPAAGRDSNRRLSPSPWGLEPTACKTQDGSRKSRRIPTAGTYPASKPTFPANPVTAAVQRFTGKRRNDVVTRRSERLDTMARSRSRRVSQSEKSVDVAFFAQLLCVLASVTPLDVGLLVLPVPGFDGTTSPSLIHVRYFIRPGIRPIRFSPSSQRTRTWLPPLCSVTTANNFVVVGHPEIATPLFFTHTCTISDAQLNGLRLVVPCDTVCGAHSAWVGLSTVYSSIHGGSVRSFAQPNRWRFSLA